MALTSQFGEITEKGLLNFSASFDFNIPDLMNNFRFPGIEFSMAKASPPRIDKLIPYKRTHILLSFDPMLMAKLEPIIKQIAAIPGVEYEQASN